MKTFSKWLKRILYFLLIVIALITCLFIIVHFSTKPSNDRNWNEDQQILPTAEIKDNLVSIRNIRNFSYTSTTDYTANYYDKTFDLNELEKVWYIVEPFSGIPGSAHTFLSFEFANNQFVSISVEIRKEKGRHFIQSKGSLIPMN